MKFVNIEWREDWEAYWLDPTAYLAKLPELAAKMPPGAAEFARDPGHYDFSSTQCVKDLALAMVSLAPRVGADAEISFTPKKFTHDSGLKIKYLKVRQFNISVRDSSSGLYGIGPLRLDEVLPRDGGCSHRIAFIGGEIYVECEDLAATWEG